MNIQTLKTKANSNYHSLGKCFHRDSSLSNETLMDFLNAMGDAESTGHPKQYPALSSIPLKSSRLSRWAKWLSGMTGIFKRRATVRDFSATISQVMLANLLLTALQPGKMRSEGLRQRPYPSAGGLYGVSSYLLSRSVDGIKSGMYNINADRQCLEQIDLFESVDSCDRWIKRNIVGEGAIQQAPAYIILAGNLQLIEKKYSDRAYRFLLLEAGHIAQNIGLVATMLNMAHVPLGGFCENNIEKFIADPDMLALYVIAVG